MVRKRKTNKKSNYFIEKEMNELVKQYKSDKNNKELFNKIAPSFYDIINGMINKQFYGNYHVKNNRADATSDCMTAILSSLERYDPNKGRLFAYTNRIVKNTLMSFYKRNRKIRDNETTYVDLTRNFDEDDVDDDVILNLRKKDEIYDDKTTEYQLLSSATCKNIILDIDTSVYIIYKYVKYLQNATQFFINNNNLYEELVDNLTYDTTVHFEFTNYIDSIIMTKYDIYYNIISDLNSSLLSILEWLEENYSDSIYVEPESYDGMLSNRALGYIRKFVNKHLNSNMTKKYDIQELIQFMQYIVYKRYNLYDED